MERSRNSKGPGVKRVLTSKDYKAFEKHLRDGWSFWSSHTAMGVGINVLIRANKEDKQLQDIRWRWDKGKYRKRGTSFAKTGINRDE